jgi:hypothetical protein
MPTIVDVLLEVNPESLKLMRERVQALANTEDPKINGVASFVRLRKIPQLHFISMQIFEDVHFDPLLVLESNFDGDSNVYWQSVLAQLSDDLRGIFACTKQAKQPKWASLFQPGNKDTLFPFLEAHSCPPSAKHFGAVANSRERIDRDRMVFDDIQMELGTTGSSYRQLDAKGVHAALRQWALEKYDFLHEAEKPTTDRAINDYKWSTLRPLAPKFELMMLFIALVFAIYVLRECGILPWHGMPGLGLIFYFVARFIVTFIVGLMIMLFLLALTLFLGGIAPFKILRHLEQSDFTQDHPELSPEQLKLFASQEDQIVQNHVASMVLVKPGMLRGFLIRTALRLLNFAVPIVAWNGYLGQMRTIHFAHWTLVGNTGRLLFLSNFDGSWQSYLDDFIDKAAHGLTLAWGNCVGFPRTQDLIFQGAAHGTEFKAWARLSQTQNILWYSAYWDLTVNQIVRNASIVDGLRKISLEQKEAEQWAVLL